MAQNQPYTGSNLGPLGKGGLDDWISSSKDSGPASQSDTDDWISSPLPKSSADSDLSDLTTSFEKPSQGRAALEGALSGASGGFRDELYGASAASGLPEVIGGFRAPIGAARMGLEAIAPDTFGDEATRAYEEGRDRIRGVQKQAEAEYPVTSALGNVAGAAALPLGGFANAATLPERIAGGALTGAGYGALYGAGTGEGATDRANNAISGGITGGLVGGAVPAIFSGVNSAAKLAGDIFGGVTAPFRNIANPQQEAAKRITSALQKDFQSRGLSLSPEEAALAREANQPVTIADLGGENVRALARSAANNSAEARQTMGDVINPRYEGQGLRAVDFVKSLVPSQADADASKIALRDAFKPVNSTLYGNAYREFSGGIPWTDGLAEVSHTPAVIDAMKGAARTMQNRTGVGRAANNGIVGPDNKLTLEAWDAVKQNLDSQVARAKTSGDRPLVKELDDVRRNLVSQLDAATTNPKTGISSYQKARGVAAELFKATDAIEAGEKFVGSKFKNSTVRSAVMKMSPEERDAFAEGYASKLVGMAREVGYRRDIVNAIFNNPASRERAEIALGKDRANQLETFFKVESVMDRLRNAMGNSTTARQLKEMGLAGDDFRIGSPTFAGILLNGVNKIKNHFVSEGQRKTAERIAEMLMSNDPSVLQSGIKALNKSPKLLRNFTDFSNKIGAISSQHAPNVPILPSIQGTVQGAAQDNQNQP